MDTHFKPLGECATSTLRNELIKKKLSHSGTRTQLIDILRSHDVTVVEETSRGTAPVGEVTDKDRRAHDRSFQPPMDTYSPMSPYIPCESVSRSRELISDAAYTVLRTQDIKAVRSLHVAEIDVIAEIKDIKILKNKLVEDYLTLRNDVEHLKVVLQNTLNKDLYMYNIANEIAWNDFDNYLHFDMPVTVMHPRFFGKIEDTVVHANLHFEIQFESNANLTNSFDIDLPIMFDGVLETCPVMVLVYSKYDESSATYKNESTTCHAYIHRNEPSKLRVYCPSLNDHNRLQFDITLRYFGKLNPTMLSPNRFSSMHYTQMTSERGHVVHHHWTELEDRIELFTNVNIVASMDDVDTIDAKLPVTCSDERYIDVVGYGIIQYTVTSDTENALIYSNNTPLVRISQSDTSVLHIKSALMLNINNYSDMNIATHIIYTKKAPRDVVQDFVVDPVYTLPGHQVTASFRTSYAVNAFYFHSIKAIHGEHEFSIPISALSGFQNKWDFKWTIPDEIEDGVVRFVVQLYDKLYQTNNEALVMTTPLSDSQVKVSVVNVGSHDVTFWLESIDITYDVPYEVRVDAVRHDGTVDASVVTETFSRKSNRVWVQMTHLRHNTLYTIRIVFTDPFERVTVFELIRYTQDIESDRPVLYNTSSIRSADGILVTGEVYHPIHNNFIWYAFASVNVLTDALVLQIVSDTHVLYGNTEFIEGILSASFSTDGVWDSSSSSSNMVYFVAVNNIDSTSYTILQSTL